MTTEEMVQWLDDHDDEYFQGERACIRAKLRAAEELAKQAEKFVELACCDGDEEVLEALDAYRAAGEVK